MSLYVDTSALIKRYVEEPQSIHCEEAMNADDQWLSARHTFVEVRRNLARLLTRAEFARVDEAFRYDWSRFAVVELDARTCEIAADIAVAHGARSLDALHLAAAQRAGGSALAFLTYDLKQAAVARSLGFTVVSV